MNEYRLNFNYDFTLTIEAYDDDSAQRAANKLARAF